MGLHTNVTAKHSNSSVTRHYELHAIQNAHLTTVHKVW